MQRWLTRIGAPFKRGRRGVRNSDARIGGIVAACAAAVLIGTSVVYTHPPGQQTVTFEATDASAIKVGQDVRVAGKSVGKVTEVALQDSVVKVGMDIENDIHVGSESRVEVRMLTPVGGYAVTLVPLGTTPLDTTPIPAGRVKVPYSIGDVLQAVPDVTDHLDGAVVDANIEQLAKALQDNPSSVGSVIGGMKSIANVMDRQRDQVHQIADLAEEYTNTFNANKDMVFELIRKMDIVLSTYNVNHAGFNQAYQLLGRVLMTLQPFEAGFLDNKDQLYEDIQSVRQMVEEYNKNMGPAIDNLVALRDKLAAWLTPEGLAKIAGGTLMADNICIPVPGRTC